MRAPRGLHGTDYCTAGTDLRIPTSTAVPRAGPRSQVGVHAGWQACSVPEGSKEPACADSVKLRLSLCLTASGKRYSRALRGFPAVVLTPRSP